MEPAVETGDHIVVAKASYGLRVPLTDAWILRWGSPSAGDDVVLKSPETEAILLKRVVATAGQTVEVRGGHVRVNGRPELAVHPIRVEPNGGPDFGPARLPRGTVLVLGDDRGKRMRNSNRGKRRGVG